MVLKYHLIWGSSPPQVLLGDVTARLKRLLREKVERLDGDRKRYVEVDRFFSSGKLCGGFGVVNTELTFPQTSKPSNQEASSMNRESSRSGEWGCRGGWIASEIVGPFKSDLGTWV